MAKEYRVGEKVTFLVGNMQVTLSFELVTPARAAEMLANEHPDNRRTPALVARYATEMLAGGWQASPEGIVLGAGDMLIDGGNRLRAQVKSGVSVTMAVWRGWSEETFRILNIGKGRSLEHADRAAGENMPKWLYQMSRASLQLDNENWQASTPIRLRARALLPAWEAIGSRLAGLRVGSMVFRAAGQLVVCVAWQSDPETAEQFLEEIALASARKSVPSTMVVTYLRWYEKAQRVGKASTLHTAGGAGAVLRNMAEGKAPSFIRPTREAYWYWRDRPEVETIFGRRKAIRDGGGEDGQA